MESKNERFGNQIIRKFFGLEVRPEVSKETEDVYKKLTDVDKSREVGVDTEDLDKAIK
jgi:hypothetical protein